MAITALVGYLREDGKYIAGVQTCDGDTLVPYLFEKFNSLDKLNRLLEKKVWSRILEKDEAEEIKKNNMWASLYIFEEVEDKQVLITPNCTLGMQDISEENGFVIEDGLLVFNSYEDALEYSVFSLSYCFNPVNSRWSMKYLG